MVIAVPGDAGTLLAPLSGTSTERLATDLLYERLATIGDSLGTVGDVGFTPQLAERWEWSPDSLSIAFHVNPRARWHDGRPVRASDVAFSVRLMKDSTLGAPGTPLIGNIDSVSVRDSLTAVAWFHRRTPEQFYDLVYQVAIVPEHVLAGTPAGQLKSADVGRKGIGSGRFRLAKWEPGQRIELVADTAHYRGRPKLDRVVMSIAPDFNTAVTRLLTGDADLFERLRPEHIAKLATDSLNRAIPYASLEYSYLALNTVDPKRPGQPHPIFGDRNVRRALTMAVDRRAMLRNVFDTIGRLAYGPFPRGLSVADTTLVLLPYDTLRARALLDSAGWRMGPDGVRTRQGRRLEFLLTTPNSSVPRKQYAVLLQDAFRRVGASMKIEEVDFPAFMAKQGAHGFDAEMASYGTDPSVSGFKQSWTTAGIAGDGGNFTSYSNRAVDALLDSAAASFSPAKTRDYARRAFQAIADDAPGIWLYEPLTVMGLHRRIRPTTLRADGWWSSLADWSIPADERTERDRIGLQPAP